MNGESGNGVCVETTVRPLDAVSPAFEIEGNMFLFHWTLLILAGFIYIKINLVLIFVSIETDVGNQPLSILAKVWIMISKFVDSVQVLKI